MQALQASYNRLFNTYFNNLLSAPANYPGIEQQAIIEVGDLILAIENEAQNGGGYSIDNAVDWLNNNAHESWRDAKGQCAKYCRNALEAGFGLEKDAFLGKTPVPARQYGPFLESQGFQPVNTTNYLKGDIAVIQGYPGATSDPSGVPYGHIQMYNGNIWISDFKQLRDFWPGGGYRSNQPSFVIYRWRK